MIVPPGNHVCTSERHISRSHTAVASKQHIIISEELTWRERNSFDSWTNAEDIRRVLYRWDEKAIKIHTLNNRRNRRCKIIF